MENRRQHYRHVFGPTRLIKVGLESGPAQASLQGELVDLSVGGMCLYMPKAPGTWAKQCSASLTLEQNPVSIRVEQVHDRVGNGRCLGFRFLPDADTAAAEAQEKVIWKFLLDEQRRRRKWLRDGTTH